MVTSLGLLLWSVGVSAVSAQTVDRIAGVVDDEVITLSEVYDLGSDFIQGRCGATESDSDCFQEAEMEVLETLVKWVLVRQQLQQLEMSVTGDEVDSAVDMVIRENGFSDRQNFRSYVEASGTTWSSYLSQLRDSLRMQRFQQVVLLPRVTVTDDEVFDAYQRSVRSERHEGVGIDAFGVLLPPQSTQEEERAIREATQGIVDRIHSGELTWEKAVATHDQAGLHGVVTGRTYRRGELTDALDQKVFEEEVGAVMQPTEVGSVLFVVRILERGLVDGDVQPLEEVNETLREQIFQRKMEEVEDDWYQRARREAAVRVLLGEE